MILSQKLADLRARAESLRANLAAAGKNPPGLPQTAGNYTTNFAALESYLRTLEGMRAAAIAPVFASKPGQYAEDLFPHNLRAPVKLLPLAQSPRPAAASFAASPKPTPPDAPEAAAAKRNVALLDEYNALVTDAERRAFGRVHGSELRASAMHNSLITYILTARELAGRCRVLVSEERAKADAFQSKPAR